MVQLRLKKPKALLFDISGTVAKTSFIDKVLLPYISANFKTYMNENWGSNAVRIDVENLRREAGGDAKAPKVSANGNKDEVIDTCAEYVNYCVDANIENKAIILLRFHMWFDGYERNRIETPVYSDVAVQIQHWRCDQEIKLYVFSNGWAEATKRFLSKTNHGDLNLLIEGHFDTTIGMLNDTETFRKVLDKVKEKPEDVTFLTKSPEEARAASNAGLGVVLVLTHRRNIERLDEQAKMMPRVRSFNELEFE